MAAEVKKLARSYGSDAIEKLAAMMCDEDAPYAVRKAAADSLLDRGYGKAQQHVEIGGPGAFDDMPDDVLDAYIRLRVRRFEDV